MTHVERVRTYPRKRPLPASPAILRPETQLELLEERAGRQQRQEARAARLRQFEDSATINDADVPAGMQRVRTPFGDRLMPIRE